MKKDLFPPTTRKVSDNTRDELNARIRKQTVDCLNVYKDGDHTILSDKIQKLDCEWDVERVIETCAASMTFLGSLFGFKKNKSLWFAVTGAVGVCLLKHALFGWSPMLCLIRKLGVRTSEEIGNEKTALKFIRGDFAGEAEDMSALLGKAEKR